MSERVWLEALYIIGRLGPNILFKVSPLLSLTVVGLRSQEERIPPPEVDIHIENEYPKELM